MEMKRFRRWIKKLTISKRQQFVVVTGALSAGLLLTLTAPFEFRYPLITTLSLAAYGLFAFSLREDLRGIEWLTLLVLPTLYTLSVALFYFLLPVRWLTRLPAIVLYAVGIYALLLTENIYNVAAGRSIALLRAAHSVGFLMTLTTYFLLLSSVLALRLWPLVNGVTIAIVSLPLIFQSLWVMELESQVSTRIARISVALTVVLGELAWVLSFWPIQRTIFALFLTTCYYGLTGIAQQYVGERLYRKTVIEFFVLVAIVFGIVLLTVRWRGNM